MVSELTEGVVINGRYRLLSLKGRGTFGEVWQAGDIMLGIEVAVKVYISLDAEGREEFKEEYRLAVNLNHSNLLAVTYFDEWEGRPFLVMRYCARGSVAALVGKMSEAQLWAFLREVASGLAYLHSLQPEPIVHQDIKPDNILVDDYGHFLISDFGISKKIRATMRKQSGRATGAGAMAFMGPERFSKEPSPIKASDIWSLGVTVCELTTGELPFCGMGGGMLKKGAEMPSLGAPWSNELNSLMQACLTLEPWNRPTAAQIAEYAAAKVEGREAIPVWNKKRSGSDVGKNKDNKDIRGTQPFAKKETPWAEVVPPRIKNEKKYERLLLYAFVICTLGLVTFIITFYDHKSPLQIEAENNLADYKSGVLLCESFVDKDIDSKPEELLKAKEKLTELKHMETKYGTLVPDYNRTATLEKRLNQKLEDASQAWANAARSQYNKLNNGTKAIEYYQLALKLKEDPDIRAEYSDIVRKYGYMKIKDMEFRNEGEGSEIIDDYGSVLKASGIKYLRARIIYDGLSQDSKTFQIFMKLYEPDRGLSRGTSSPEGYTGLSQITVWPGNNRKVNLDGWGTKNGGYYKPGTYRYELWYEGKKLYSKTFTLQ